MPASFLELDHDRLIALAHIELTPEGTPTASAMSAIEAAAFLAGEPLSVQPHNVDPFITHVVRSLNENLDSEPNLEDLYRERLRAYVPRIVGTAFDGKRDEREAMFERAKIALSSDLRKVAGMDTIGYSNLMHSAARIETELLHLPRHEQMPAYVRILAARDAAHVLDSLSFRLSTVQRDNLAMFGVSRTSWYADLVEARHEVAEGLFTLLDRMLDLDA